MTTTRRVPPPVTYLCKCEFLFMHELCSAEVGDVQHAIIRVADPSEPPEHFRSTLKTNAMVDKLIKMGLLLDTTNAVQLAGNLKPDSAHRVVSPTDEGKMLFNERQQHPII